MNNNVKIATQAQLKELQEKGVGSFGYSNDVFKRIDIPYLLELVEKEIQMGTINGYINSGVLQIIALQLYIEDLDLNNDKDLEEFRDIYQYFNNTNTYYNTLNALEENN